MNFQNFREFLRYWFRMFTSNSNLIFLLLQDVFLQHQSCTQLLTLHYKFRQKFKILACKVPFTFPRPQQGLYHHKETVYETSIHNTTLFAIINRRLGALHLVFSFSCSFPSTQYLFSLPPCFLLTKRSYIIFYFFSLIPSFATRSDAFIYLIKVNPMPGE